MCDLTDPRILEAYTSITEEETANWYDRFTFYKSRDDDYRDLETKRTNTNMIGLFSVIMIPETLFLYTPKVQKV
jgi:hypothetical protein